MGSVQKAEEEWRAILTPQQFHILRQKGTEPRGTGHYDKFYEEGIYNCAGCGTPLYKSTTKFDSGCGWPAFFEGVPGAITRSVGIPTFFMTMSHFVSHFVKFMFVVCFSPTLMAGGRRSLAPPVVATWGMSSRERGTRCRQTRGIALTASRSSSWRPELRKPLHSVVLDGVESLACDFLMFSCEFVMDFS
ncbi:uncharacterized protein LOC130991610 isoform X1 [Salvia miltiorrhiza]|uniref:uncharacterized protein LOC130991610 isoform X1 n=1 Tax=Salvia miltiorrhiza TaxID=226208 RepID=UPI0025AC4D27|nr:uncharacterized protein LOC130991610 isoform X1 [Salvia miltiorrhiza]